MKPAIFLDRDGTLNYNCPYCRTPEEIILYKDIFKPLRELASRYYIIVVTNQSGVGRGYFTEKALAAMNNKLKAEIKRHGGRVDAIYYCPHLPDQGCNCRKPKTGMIDSAAKDFKIDKSRSFMIGDSDVDMELGKNVGITRIRVRERGNKGKELYAKDFNQALKIIKKKEKIENNVPSMALILAGGQGTRMRPLTYRIPKPMARIYGKPILEHIIKGIVNEGIHEIFLSVGYKSNLILKYFGDGSRFNANIHYIVEKRPLGTGGALKLALKKIKTENGDAEVFVTNGDDMLNLSISSLYKQHKNTRADATLTLKKINNVAGSGVAVLSGKRIKKFVEKPQNKDTQSHLGNMGKYIFNTRIISLFPRAMKFSLEKDFFEKMSPKARVYAYIIKSKWYPINSIDQLKKAKSEWR